MGFVAVNYSPWPDPGKNIKFTLRKCYAVRCSYAGKWPLWALRKTFKATWGRWPFLTVRIGKYGFYIGWKPINLEDSHFAIPDGIQRTSPACELSMRTSNSRHDNE